MFSGHLILRRLFFSACEIGNDQFINEVTQRNRGMHSIVGPENVVGMDHSVAMWTSLYISLFAENEDRVTHARIKERISALVTLFPMRLKIATYNPTYDTWNKEVISSESFDPT